MRRPLIVCAVLAAAPAARAEVCEPLAPPAAASVRDTGLDRARDACPRSAIDSGIRTIALLDAPEFYGTLSGSLFVDVHLARGDHELFAGVRALDYRFAQNAVVTATELALGPVHVGALRAFETRLGDRALVLAPSVRVDLPRTDTGYGITTAAATAALLASFELAPRWRLHGRAGAIGWAARSGDALERRGAAALSADAAWLPGSWAGLALGTEAQGGWYGAGLDHLLARASARFALGASHRIGVAVAAPLVGRERTDLVVRIGYRRDL